MVETSVFAEPSLERSPYIASGLSLFAPGLGQIYNGQVAKTFVIWFSFIFASSFFIWASLPIWAIAVWDAYNIASMTQ